MIEYANTQLREGDVTILNQAKRLRDMYEYFAEGAASAYGGSGRMSETGSWRGRNLFLRETEGYYNSVAMVAAYFSWLEHILVLGLPFNGPVDKQPSLKTFVRRPWSEKFKGVFDNHDRPKVASVYLRLQEVANQFRNAPLHGNVSATTGTIGFHLPGFGGVSMTIAEPKFTPSLFFVPFDQRGFAHARRAFASADRLLQTDRRSRYGLLWAESGLDVSYDLDSRRRYADACRNITKFSKEVEAARLAWERAVNMDW